jgi:hypothetical protein
LSPILTPVTSCWTLPSNDILMHVLVVLMFFGRGGEARSLVFVEDWERDCVIHCYFDASKRRPTTKRPYETCHIQTVLPQNVPPGNIPATEHPPPHKTYHTKKVPHKRPHLTFGMEFHCFWWKWIAWCRCDGKTFPRA